MANRKYTPLPFIEKPVASGNFGTTGRLPIKTIVWHTADGTLPGTLGWFNDRRSGVSSNYVIDTNGQLYALLEEFYVPYTNGNLTSNRQSITIEVIDNQKPNGARPDAVYVTAAKLCRDLCAYYGLPINRTTNKGHNEVSSTHPQCPGSLDVDRIVRQAQPIPATPNWSAIAQESAKPAFGYMVEGTPTDRLAKIQAIYKKHGFQQ